MAHFSTERAIVAQQAQNRLGEIETSIFRTRRSIAGWESVTTGAGQDVAPPPASGWQPYELGTLWGGYDVVAWFRARVIVPVEWAGETVSALLRPGFEGLCYVNGVPMQGLDRNRDEVVLAEKARGGETFDIVIEAYGGTRPGMGYTHRFESADLAVRDRVAWDTFWDFRVGLDVVKNLPDNSAPRVQLLDVLDRAIKMIDLNAATDDLAVYHETLCRAQESWRSEVKRFEHSWGMGKLALIGHSHIDTAWLWPLRETRRKCSRTFSTALKYMEEYPEYVFSQSQPQLYEYVKDNYPTIWAKIKARVREGRWEPIGGGWVEQDSNIAGAEALVRQYLYGNRFFRKEFGIHTKIAWLPDAFGYPITLPQIIRKAQMDAFATTKLGWNQYNEFPYTFFRWRGLDGTEIHAYMHPCNSRTGYNGNITPEQLIDHWNKYKQKDLCDEIWFSFGFGDGGGGATKAMLENGIRLQNMVGIPQLRFDRLQDSFDRAAKKAPWDALPVFHDELYFELHRGVQTSQARTKRNNRKSELAMRDAELMASIASLSGHSYPRDAFAAAWKTLLTNQFHDILPGSSIGMVYDEADRDYAEIIATANGARDAALGAIAGKIATAGAGRPIVVTNTLGWVRNDVALVEGSLAPGEAVLDPSGMPVYSQNVEQDGKPAILFEATGVPALGHAVYRIGAGSAPARNGLKASESRLENDCVRVDFAKNGTIRRIYDKLAARDVLPKGAQANVLQLLEDRPQNWEAWDVDFNIDEGMTTIDDVVSIAVTEMGPVRATVRVVKRTAKSTIAQDISLHRASPAIDFVTTVDWWEKRKFLKAAFPVDVLARTATFEIQYGAIERPTHRSTSWDRARFEVPAHRWIDLSEADYGVSLLNDCKYGFDVHENVLRISLLRAPINPDPHADEGRHVFTYRLLPHAGTWREAGTVRRGYELNASLLARATDAHPGEFSPEYGWLSVDRENVVVDCVKKAEDSDAVIVRLYEAHGGRGPVALSFARTPASVTECDLMEENDSPVDAAGPVVRFEIKPWEIRTFKVAF